MSSGEKTTTFVITRDSHS